MRTQQTFTTLIRRRYDGTSYNFYAAHRENRVFEYVDVTIRVEVREWVGGFPLFGLCVAAAPVTDPRTGCTIFQEEDEVRLDDADVKALRRECAEHYARLDDERRREIVAGYVYGAHGYVSEPFPDYDAAEFAEVGILPFPAPHCYETAA